MKAPTQYLTCMVALSTTPKECDSEAASEHAIKESKARRPPLCYYCSTRHEPRASPAWGKRCSLCNKLNHAVDACKKAEQERGGIETRGKKETANTVTPSATSSSKEKEIAKDHFVCIRKQP